MDSTVYISGLNSGQNPCAGVGIARCLRQAYPDLQLTGVDHWQGSSGLHSDVLNDVLLLPQWKQINRDRHREFLRSRLDKGNFWIPAIDVEIYWIAQNFGEHENLLAPNGRALEMTAKPGVEAFRDLGFLIPDSISAFLADSEIHSFLRRHSWLCWLKGPYHDAKRISSWSAFEEDREAMRKAWKTDRLFVQRHVLGCEESICFSAYQGQLMDVVHMQKRLTTAEGKTWAGQIRPVTKDFFRKFADIIEELNWSGGGEIEFTRDYDGNKWMIECNPRFPAWIYGTALAGTNLPAKMISKVTGRPYLEAKAKTNGFTRIVHEVPVKEEIGLPMPPDPSLTGWTADRQIKGKGVSVLPASLPDLRDRMCPLEDDPKDDSAEPAVVNQENPQPYLEEVSRNVSSHSGHTPARLLLSDWTHTRFRSVLERISRADRHPEVRIGYSVKTSTTDQHLHDAKSCGFLAECISQMEIRRALEAGFTRSELILNGPGKFWPLERAPETGLHMVFCDSLEEFDRAVMIPRLSGVMGFRIQLPKLRSRFGVPIEKIENFRGILDRVRKLNGIAALGFHFHMPSWSIGLARWKEAIKSLLTWCEVIEKLTGCSVRHLDLGGGFFPSDLERIDLGWVQRAVRETLPEVEAIYFEPGRSLTQEGEVLVSRILDVRRCGKGKIEEVVVDACIAELPTIHSYSHRVFFRPANDQAVGPVSFLEKGSTKVLGRICMENDVLDRGLDVPASARVGDFIIFGDAGAYERSMSYDFGRG